MGAYTRPRSTPGIKKKPDGPNLTDSKKTFAQYLASTAETKLGPDSLDMMRKSSANPIIAPAAHQWPLKAPSVGKGKQHSLARFCDLRPGAGLTALPSARWSSAAMRRAHVDPGTADPCRWTNTFLKLGEVGAGIAGQKDAKREAPGRRFWWRLEEWDSRDLVFFITQGIPAVQQSFRCL